MTGEMKIRTRTKIAAFLFGKHKTELVKFCLKKKYFYQAEAAFALRWRLSVTQYYLNLFVKHNLLIKTPTSYRTYYQINSTLFSKIKDLI